MVAQERDIGREPCPDRIVEDLGGAFGMGCIGGFLWHLVKGMRNSPKGERWKGGLFSARSRAPILGGNFAVWGGTFSAFDCSLQYIRQRDDHWNAIASGFLTGGVLAARGGWKAASRNAVVGGVLLGIIEGVAALIMRTTTQTPREQALQALEAERMMREERERLNGGETPKTARGWFNQLSQGPVIPKSGDEAVRSGSSEFVEEKTASQTPRA
jgi:import inner membrane translocase subunit TIM17